MKGTVWLCAVVYAALLLTGCASQTGAVPVTHSRVLQFEDDLKSPFFGVSTFEEFVAAHPPVQQDDAPLQLGEERLRPVGVGSDASESMVRAAGAVNVPTLDQVVAMLAREAAAETEKLIADGAKRLVARIRTLEADMTDALVYVGLTERDGITLAVFDRQTPNPVGQKRLKFDTDFCRVRLKHQLSLGNEAGAEQMMVALEAIIKKK